MIFTTELGCAGLAFGVCDLCDRTGHNTPVGAAAGLLSIIYYVRGQSEGLKSSSSPTSSQRATLPLGSAAQAVLQLAAGGLRCYWAPQCEAHRAAIGYLNKPRQRVEAEELQKLLVMSLADSASRAVIDQHLALPFAISVRDAL